MKSLSRACLALLLLCAPLLAAASTSLAVVAKSDRVELHLQSSAPMTYKEKMLSSSVLAIEVSPATLKPGTPKRVAVDKGLIQTVTLEQQGNSVVVKLAVISRPRLLKASPDAGGRKLTLVYSTADIATNKPSGFSTVAPGKSGRPAASTRASQPVPAIRPSSPTVSSSSSSVPVRPLAPEPAATVAATPPPTPGGAPRINLTFVNASLDDVLVRIADQAGLRPQLSPDLEGSYSGTLNDLPLDQALQAVAQGRNLTWQILNGYLVVNTVPVPVSTGATPTVVDPPPAVSAPPPVASTPEPVLPEGPLAREYYPIRTQAAANVVNSARSVLPNIRYTIDERLNLIMAEGSPSDIERLTMLLKEVSAK